MGRHTSRLLKTPETVRDERLCREAATNHSPGLQPWVCVQWNPPGKGGRGGCVWADRYPGPSINAELEPNRQAISIERVHRGRVPQLSAALSGRV